MEGQTLAKVVDGGSRCTEASITAIALQLLDILQYFSSCRPAITHRLLPDCCPNMQLSNGVLQLRFESSVLVNTELPQCSSVRFAKITLITLKETLAVVDTSGH